jgi:hypothetical protein
MLTAEKMAVGNAEGVPQNITGTIEIKSEPSAER